MSMKQKLAVFAIGLAITIAVGATIGMLDHSHIAFARPSDFNNQQNAQEVISHRAPVNSGTQNVLGNLHVYTDCT
jgi:hypothetical protein